MTSRCRRRALLEGPILKISFSHQRSHVYIILLPPPLLVISFAIFTLRSFSRNFGRTTVPASQSLSESPACFSLPPLLFLFSSFPCRFLDSRPVIINRLRETTERSRRKRALALARSYLRATPHILINPFVLGVLCGGMFGRRRKNTSTSGTAAETRGRTGSRARPLRELNASIRG